jgi:branched-chain amino acid transport system substrate-binding protein
MRRRLALLAAALAAAAIWPAAADTPGVTATEIKIGNTTPYSGPASAYSVLGKIEAAYFQMINDHGGIAGHKINFISLDDSYSPPKTVEAVRRLVEEDQVAFLFATLGTPTNTAIQKYLNSKKVPQLFVATAADKWANYKDYPWTISLGPSYRTEARVYAKYILSQKPNAKIAILYQNDDFGKDYMLGLKDVLGERYPQMVKEATYETSETTIDSQVVTLKDSGADTFVLAAIPKFAAQAIRKVYDIGWHPLFVTSFVSTSVGAVMEPVGKEKGIGMITAVAGKDPTDPAWNDDAGMKEWRAFMNKYLPGADQKDAGYVTGYLLSEVMAHVLRQCNGDFSRDNVMKQATSIRNLKLGLLLPGVVINTRPDDYRGITQMQLERWDGNTWVRFGNLIDAAATGS